MWRAHLDDIGHGPLSVLSAAERAAAHRPGLERKRLRRGGARAVLRVLLGGYLGVNPSSLRFSQLPSGKPVVDAQLARGYADLDFSVSHSEGLALIAISRAGAVGVDVEIIGRRFDHARLATKLLGESEAERIAQLGAEQGRREFLRAWTRREATLKCRGTASANTAARRPVRPWVLEFGLGPMAIATLAAEHAPGSVRFQSVKAQPAGSLSSLCTLPDAPQQTGETL